MGNLSFEDLNDMNFASLEKVELLEHLRIVRFKGPIDKSTLEVLLELRNKLAETSDINAVNILFDFEKVTKVDTSTAIQLISRFTELQRENKVLGLINISNEFSGLMEQLHIETTEPIRFFNSEEEAVAALNQ